MKVLGIGSTRLDFFLHPPYFPNMGEEVKLQDSSVRIGGSVLNTASLLAELGMNTLFYTDLYHDTFSQFVREQLKQTKIQVLTNDEANDKGKGTPVSYIMVSGSDRTMYSYDSSYLEVKMTSEIRELTQSADAFFTSCYEITDDTIDVMSDILKTMNKRGKPCFLDLTPLSQYKDRDVWDTILPSISHLTGTKDELLQVMSILGMNEIHELFESFRINKVYMKNGKKGSMLFVADGAKYEAFVTPIDATNVTGCGDAYHAGVIYGTLHGYSDEETIKFANLLGERVARYTFLPKKIVSTLRG